VRLVDGYIDVFASRTQGVLSIADSSRGILYRARENAETEQNERRKECPFGFLKMTVLLNRRHFGCHKGIEKHLGPSFNTAS